MTPRNSNAVLSDEAKDIEVEISQRKPLTAHDAIAQLSLAINGYGDWLKITPDEVLDAERCQRDLHANDIQLMRQVLSFLRNLTDSSTSKNISQSQRVDPVVLLANKTKEAYATFDKVDEVSYAVWDTLTIKEKEQIYIQFPELKEGDFCSIAHKEAWEKYCKLDGKLCATVAKSPIGVWEQLQPLFHPDYTCWSPKFIETLKRTVKAALDNFEHEILSKSNVAA